MVFRNSINLSTRPKEGVHFTYRRSYRGEESCGSCARILDSCEVSVDGLVKKAMGSAPYSSWPLSFSLRRHVQEIYYWHGLITDDGGGPGRHVVCGARNCIWRGNIRIQSLHLGRFPCILSGAGEYGDDTARVSSSWPLSGAATVQSSSTSKITHLDCPQT